MSLEPYKRGKYWWARGTVDLNGRAITDYIRTSTGAFDRQGALDWIHEFTTRTTQSHINGDTKPEITFAEAVMLYDPKPQDAKYLIPIVEKIGDDFVKDIFPRRIRDLCPILYPDASTDTWVRHVIVPIRAVINNAHDLGHCPPIKVKAFTTAERVAQDNKRGKKSRVKREPGSWDWILKFHAAADQHVAALAHFMFATGARISQAIALRPEDLNLQEGWVEIPSAKGQPERRMRIPHELVVELANLKPKVPRGWARSRDNLRVFGYAGRDGPRKAWANACRAAGIQHLPPHSAGRHGFGQEMRVRQGVDSKAVAEIGGWADSAMLDRVYTHAEEAEEKVLDSYRTGRVQAENETGLNLLNSIKNK